MAIVGLTLLALAPGIFLVIYFQRRDRVQREPWKVIIISFLLGALTVILAAALEIALLGDDDFGSTIPELAFSMFLIVALVEELCKLLVIQFYSARRPEFDELMDGLVYGAAAAAGFATLENVGYVLENGFLVGIIRAVLSVPMHVLTGAWIGYWIARSRFEGTPYYLTVLIGLGMAIFVHGTFNVGVMAEQKAFIVMSVVVVLILLGLVIVVARRALQLSEAQARESLVDRIARTSTLPVSMGGPMASAGEGQPVAGGHARTVLIALFYALGVVSLITGLFFGLGVGYLFYNNEIGDPFNLESVIMYFLVALPLAGAVFFPLLGHMLRRLFFED